MKDPLIEVTRSHSKTIYPNGAYKSESVFCSAKTTVNLSEAEQTSETIFQFCHSEVEKDCNRILGLPEPRQIEKADAPNFNVKTNSIEPDPPSDPPFAVYAAEEPVLSNIGQNAEDKPKRGRKKTVKPEDTQVASEDTQNTYTATDSDLPAVIKGETPQADRLKAFAEKAAKQTGRSVEYCKHNMKAFIINYLEVKHCPTPDEDKHAEKIEPAIALMESFTEAQITRLTEAPFMLSKEVKAPTATA